MKKILLIDGHNLLFRMFYGIPAPIKNSKNQDIRALIGFLGSLKKLVKEFKPYSIYVIFDSETSKQKNSLIDNEYKKNRIDYSKVASEENPFTQLPKIKKALSYLRIPHIEVNNNETDDFIASIIKNKGTNIYDYVIISTDSDFIQLIDKNVSLYVQRGKKSLLYNKDEVLKKYDVPPNKFVLYKSLVGDKSDNIKGIKGIGKITAAKVLKYSSIADYILRNKKSKVSFIIKENQKQLTKNLKVIKLDDSIDTSKITFSKISNLLITESTFTIIEAIGER